MIFYLPVLSFLLAMRCFFSILRYLCLFIFLRLFFRMLCAEGEREKQGTKK